MDAVEEVKARLDIEQVVGKYVDLKRSGSGLKGLCPFHAEKTPSFFVFPARGTFRCFGCGQGGDILTFVENYEKVDFREALQRLAAQAGVELPNEKERKQVAEANSRLYEANAAAVEFFREALKSATSRRATEYLQTRKISAQAQHAFGLGYAPDSRHALYKALTARGFANEDLLAAGLIMQSKDGTQLRDRFFGRLMFPIRDARGRVTGFGGRILGDGEPKYLNSPQTEIFDKSRSLFGIDQAHETVRQGHRVIVVEGYVDAIRAHQAGFHDVVASLGTAITPQQLQLCARLAWTVTLALDPDPAGQAAAARTALAALAALPRKQRQLPDSLGRRMVDVGLSVDLRIARIPPGAGDPDEVIQRDPKAWTQIIDASIPAFEFYFDTVVEASDRSTDGWRQEIIDRVIPVIQEFPFAVGTQAAWVERLAEVTGVQSRLLQNRLFTEPDSSGQRPGRRSRNVRAPAVAPPTRRAADPAQDAEDSLLQILLRRPCPAEVVPALADLRPSRPAAAELLNRCISQAGSGRRPSLAEVSREAQDLAETLTREDLDAMPEHRIVPAVRLHVAAIRMGSVRGRLEDMKSSLGEIGEEDQETGRKALLMLLEERDELEKQIDRLQHEVLSGV